MKKRIIVFCIPFLIIILFVLMLNFSEDNRVIYSDKKSNQVMNTNALTMMYETEAGSGEYQVSSENMWPQEGYTFNERLSECENGSKLIWDDDNKRVVMQASTSDKCFVYFDKEPDAVYLADYITSQYTTDGANGLYLHDADLTNGANDNSYRYAGANPNNYVCFGSDEATCPADNLYRVIGVFNSQVKLIKNSSIGNYAWDSDDIDFSSTLNVNNTNSDKSTVVQLGEIWQPLNWFK